MEASGVQVDFHMVLSQNVEEVIFHMYYKNTECQMIVIHLIKNEKTLIIYLKENLVHVTGILDLTSIPRWN